MSNEKRNKTFLEGTALLAMATAIVKVIGALYKIPLNAIIGAEGFGYFNTAYEIYNILLIISTAGLPVAMSRMISQANSLEHYNQVRQVYRTSRFIFLAIGITGSLLMTIFCRQLAAFQNQPDAWAAIGFLGPCVLLICIMSTFRGYFQGQGDMLPTSVSQVLEAVVKLVIGMVAALLFLRATQSIPLAAGGAILGVTASCAVSCVYLFSRFRKNYLSLPDSGESADSFRNTAVDLLKIAVPITVGTAGLQFITVLSSKIYMGQLLASGVTQQSADVMRGIHVMTQTIYNMPCAFISPITISIIPAITAQLTLGRPVEAKNTEEAAIRITGLVAMPCAVGLTVLARPITALLGGYTGERLDLATSMMTVLGISLAFNAVTLVTTAIMQAHGKVNRPVVNMFIGGILKLIMVYVLTGNPTIGIVGTPIATMTSYILICILNLYSIHTMFSPAPALVRNLVRSFLAAALMGALTWLAWFGLTRLGIGSRLLLCGVPIAVGGVVYLLTAVRMKVITRADCLLLPKGEKIANLLKL